MAKKKKEEDKKTKFEEFAEQYINVKAYKYGLEDVGQGKGNDDMPGLVQKVLFENTALGDSERERLWSGVKTELNNYYVISPYLKEGQRKETKRFIEFGKENLEGILNSTPDDFIGKILLKNAPDEEHPTSGEYKELGELHNRMLGMKSTLDAFKDTSKVGESEKGRLIEGIRSDVLKYYEEKYQAKDGDDEKTIADKQAALKFFKAVIEYKEDDIGRFAIESYKDILGEVSHEFSEKIQGNEIDYLKSFLKEEEILGVYSNIFDEMYQRKEK